MCNGLIWELIGRENAERVYILVYSGAKDITIALYFDDLRIYYSDIFDAYRNG